MAAFNRQLFVPGTHALTDDELARGYDIIFGSQPDVTQVFENIPARAAGPALRPV